ncbi:PREDICTED: hyaluronidase PH-20 [Elephantulus edwardii]|uniref:hyaluronidase PH-20 n=1 Tax=Elephantulus edwardii TaxID=28737 RepID=UPI0003F0C513|nr:PREDICTED: hyaluronidase PH-20 [Elephantulus edwardii]
MPKFKNIFFGSMVESSRPSQAMFTFLLLPCCLTANLRAPSLIPGVPFLWGWNIPTDLCSQKFNVTIDLRLFSFIGSSLKYDEEQNITIFYEHKLGYYPYINEKTGTMVNGGIPQMKYLPGHLIKAQNDMCCVNGDHTGLAIIDWENWRPIWDRNWKPKDVYRKASINIVQKENANLTRKEATQIAKKRFEVAAKGYMIETLKIGQITHPKSIWGFYLFPECYNHNYRKPGYNGSCIDIEKKRNDALSWLWKRSTALYPSVYLQSFLASSALTPLFTRNRALEAIRVSNVRNPENPLPIFVYTRPEFTDKPLTFLAQEDLVNTYGELVTLGVSGSVLWGNLNLTQSQRRNLSIGIHPFVQGHGAGKEVWVA